MATKAKKTVKNKKVATKKEEEKVVIEEKKEKVKKVKAKKDKKEKKKREGFIKTTIREMKQVKFPTRKEMVKLSIATIVFVIFFGVLFFGVDALMSWLKQVM